MIIGVPKEVKEDEYRVAMTPAGVEVLAHSGHTVLVEAEAGSGTGITNEEYAQAGATIVESAAEVWAQAELIVKVKEPMPQEYPLIRPQQILFTFFHFAASETLTQAMVNSGAICIAYETIQLPNGMHPILTPMSEIAGRLAIQVGAWSLMRPFGGRGVLLSGVPGVLPGNVVVVGAGVVGANAARIAAGFGANVKILDIHLDRLRYLEEIMPPNVDTLYSNPENLRESLRDADLLVGAVYLSGERTPKLVNRDSLRLMKPGSVLVDVCVDQGGFAETTHPTSHRNPTYVEENVIHYAVANMPGAVARTSTYALTNVTLPYVQAIARKGFPDALRDSELLRLGLNVAAGKVTLQPIAKLFGYDYTPVEDAL
ncbi:MAG: alanine dehydrogenase [Fimbriimonadia bacterium]|nr:alanine dehydrogenase [Fimbriimonadia bacterium]